MTKAGQCDEPSPLYRAVGLGRTRVKLRTFYLFVFGAGNPPPSITFSGFNVLDRYN
jgi:hypothetical protein